MTAVGPFTGCPSFRYQGIHLFVRLLTAIATLRAQPPGGLDPAYIDGFVARNRPSLLTLIHGAFGGAA